MVGDPGIEPGTFRV